LINQAAGELTGATGEGKPVTSNLQLATFNFQPETSHRNFIGFLVIFYGELK
jgi:hypothetical protein